MGLLRQPHHFPFLSFQIIQMTKLVLVTALVPVYFDGQTHKAGQSFSIPEGAHLDAYKRDKLVVESNVPVVVPTEEIETFVSDADELAALTKTWDAGVDPAEYLKQFPQGPFADVAMRIVELQAEAAEFDGK